MKTNRCKNVERYKKVQSLKHITNRVYHTKDIVAKFDYFHLLLISKFAKQFHSRNLPLGLSQRMYNTCILATVYQIHVLPEKTN